MTLALHGPRNKVEHERATSISNGGNFPYTLKLLAGTDAGLYQVAQEYLGKHASLGLVSEDSCTALHIATYHRLSTTALILLNRGINPNSQAKGSLTPLHMAAGIGDTQILSLLLERGADPSNTYMFPYRGVTPLADAAFNEQLEAARILVEHDSNLLLQPDNLDRYPVELIDVNKHPEFFRFLATETITAFHNRPQLATETTTALRKDQVTLLRQCLETKYELIATLTSLKEANATVIRLEKKGENLTSTYRRELKSKEKDAQDLRSYLKDRDATIAAREKVIKVLAVVSAVTIPIVAALTARYTSCAIAASTGMPPEESGFFEGLFSSPEEPSPFSFTACMLGQR